MTTHVRSNISDNSFHIKGIQDHFCYSSYFIFQEKLLEMVLNVSEAFNLLPVKLTFPKK